MKRSLINMRRLPFLIPLAIAVLLAATCAAPSVAATAQTFYVSPTGADENPGTSAQPWRTLEHARDKVREAAADGRADVVIMLRGGEYLLASMLVFDMRDGGSNRHSVIYRAAEGQQPVISGGRRITGWTPMDAGGLWRAPVKDLDFRQLYVNGQRAIRARTPNRTNDATMGPFFRVVSVGKSNLVVKTTDLAAMKSPEGVELVMNSHWHHKRLRIETVNGDGNRATITPKMPERTADFFSHFANTDDPFFLENAREFLDAPGEWFLDSQAHVVYYLPRPGEDMTTAAVVAPTVETLVRIQGTPEAPVTNLRFEGIRFEYSTWLAPSREGLVDNQSMVEEGGWGWLNGPAATRPNPGAVELRNAREVTFEGNTFQHLGCQDIVLFAPSAHNRIIGNTFVDISAGAIVVNPTTARDGSPSEHDTITDNTITRCGQDYTSACGIIATYAAFLTIEHNELSDLPYTGTSIGWGWGATPNTKALHDNSVRFNHIHHVMQCHDDGAGIYTLERQNGTLVNENYVHDIGRSPWAGDYVNAGIYFDNGSSFITAERNVVERVRDDKFIKVQDWPKADTTHDLTLRDNDGKNPAVKAAAGPRRPARADGVAEQHRQIGIKPQGSPQPFRRNEHPDAQWFAHAGLGLFIHWGISSVDGRIDLSWGMMTNTPWDKGAFKLTPNQYFALADRFQPDRYDPRKWLRAAKEAGFQYVVLTTRHHDGYALWPSKVSDFSTATHMRGRDLLKDYVEACREYGLKVGFYYSPPDWHYNRDWMAFNWREDRDPYLGLDHQPISEPKRSLEETKEWDRKYRDYIRSQVEELLTRYGRINLLWFDGGPEAISFERIRELQPGIVVNPRMHGHGDFTTAEVGFPKTRPQPWWEMCAIWNGAWGYLKQEQYGSTTWMLEQFSHVRSWGGNYLINIGPRPNGELPDVAYERFRELGAWMKTNGVAVLDVEGGPWPERCNVPITRKGRHFYLLVPPRFQDAIVLKQAPEPRKLTLLGRPDALDSTYDPQVLTVRLKSTQRSGLVDVLDLEW